MDKILGPYEKSVVKIILKNHKGTMLPLGVRALNKVHAGSLCKALNTT